jgi:hypothetical protein
MVDFDPTTGSFHYVVVFQITTLIKKASGHIIKKQGERQIFLKDWIL